MFILLGLCKVCEQESCVCMCFHANSARQVALQARWLQLLDMAWTQGALCGARSRTTDSTHSWLWGISFPLEVCEKKVRQYRLSDLSVFRVLGMLEWGISPLHKMEVKTWLKFSKDVKIALVQRREVFFLYFCFEWRRKSFLWFLWMIFLLVNRYNIPELAKTHTVYAMDLLGFGWSEKALIEYDALLWRDQVADFVKEVVGKPAVLAGNRCVPALWILKE